MADENKKMVGFKRGLQANLDALLSTTSTADVGTFYLTTDTNRLYIRSEDGLIRPVNAGILTVDQVNAEANKTSLPVATTDAQKQELMGKYYYAVKENVLCIHNGEKWIQINSVVTNSSFTASVATADNIATITNTITDSTSTALSSSYKLEMENIGLKKETKDGIDKITLTGDVYTLSAQVPKGENQQPLAETVQINLTSQLNNENSSSLVLTSNDQSVKIACDATGKINLTVPPAAAGFEVEDSTLSTSYGEGNKGFAITITDHKTNSDSVTIAPKIQIGETKYEFSEGVASLPVYSKEEVNAKFRGFNAMEYRGTISGTLPTEEVAIGYAYLANGEVTLGSTSYPSGTLFVATVSDENYVEDASGHIKAEDIVWTVVSNANTDTTYSLVHEDGILGFGLKNNTTLGVEHFQLVNGDLAVESNQTDKNGLVIDTDATSADGSVKVKIGHKVQTGGATSETSVTQVPNTDLALSYVSGITKDAFGHIVGFTTKTATLKDSYHKLSSLGVTASVSDGKVTIIPQAELDLGDSSKESLTVEQGQLSGFTIASDSLEITQDTSNASEIHMDLVWGSF